VSELREAEEIYRNSFTMRKELQAVSECYKNSRVLNIIIMYSNVVTIKLEI